MSETKVWLFVDGERQDLVVGAEFLANRNVVTLLREVTNRIATYKR